MSSPLVTVVTVSLNCKELIKQTIDSVCSQVYPRFEYIIIDGGSIDGTISIILKNFNRIDKYVSEKDDGIYDAMNKGIILASPESQFITFLNAGDVFSDKNVIKDIVSNLSIPRLNIYGNYTKNNVLVNAPSKINQYVLSTNMVCHQAIFFNTETHKKYLYDTQFKICADYKLLNEFVRAGEKFQKINRTIVNFDAGGVSHTNRERLHAEKNMIRKNYPKLYIYHFLKIGMNQLKNIFPWYKKK